MTIRLLLGDQLNHNHSWFDIIDSNVYYVMFEMKQETNYVRHHVQKVVAFFAAMRHFASKLEQKGHQIVYYKLDAKENQQELEANLKKLLKEKKATAFEYQEPDEYRLDEQLKAFCKSLEIQVKIVNSEHF